MSHAIRQMDPQQRALVQHRTGTAAEWLSLRPARRDDRREEAEMPAA